MTELSGDVEGSENKDFPFFVCLLLLVLQFCSVIDKVFASSQKALILLSIKDV